MTKTHIVKEFEGELWISASHHTESVSRSYEAGKATTQREWKGLTATERKVLWLSANNPREYGELIEAKLKERNST